jgi:hypothetical protein
VLIIALSRRKRRKKARTGSTRTVCTISARNSPTAIAADRARRQAIAAAEKASRDAFKRRQAAADLVHLQQVKRDLLEAYEKSGVADRDDEKSIRRRISYDSAIRRTEKQIETAAYKAGY